VLPGQSQVIASFQLKKVVHPYNANQWNISNKISELNLQLPFDYEGIETRSTNSHNTFQ